MMFQNVNTFASRKNTVLIIQKINRNDALRNQFAERGNLLMLRMNRVKIERRAIGINGDKSRIERTFEMQNVAPDGKT